MSTPVSNPEINKVKTGANAVTYVIVVVLALIAVNVIASRLGHRVDFTEDKLYSLSAGSKALVAALPDRMTVKAFISQKSLEPRDAANAQYLRDLLEEYARASNGKFVWESIDPSEDKKLEEEAEKLKVPKLQRSGVSQDKFTVSANYLGVALQYQGKIESIPAVQGIEGLEFQLSSLIKMLSVKKKKIAFAASEGELPLGQGQQGGHAGLSMLAQVLGSYEVVSQPLTGKLLADDFDALVIAGPRQATSERAKFVIDQFVMKGKPVAFLVDGMVIDQPGGGPPGGNQPQLGRKNDHGLDDLLEHYGVKVHDDIVMEPRQNAPGPLLIRGRVIPANYPTFTVAKTLGAAHPITEQIRGVIFPMGSSLELVSGKQAGLSFMPLATSTDEAWRQAGLFVFDPETPLKPQADKGPFTYAYAATGKVTSFFAGKAHPSESGAPVEPAAPNTSAPPDQEAVLDASAGPVRLVFVGDSGFVSDEYLRMIQVYRNYEVDLLFALGIFDWMVQDETLAPLRKKVFQARPLVVDSERTPALIKYGNVVGVPLVFIALGLLRWRLRTSRRRNAHI